MASAAEQLAANMDFGAFQKATELHKRLMFTLLAMIVYRLGTYIPIPGVDPVAIASIMERQQNGIFGMANLFSGGAVSRMAIFALNVMPYISASIIVQLLQSVYPPWEKLKKEGGEAGRKQLNQYTRYLTVVLALFQSFGIAVGLSSQQGLVYEPRAFFIVSTIAVLTGGTLFLMWLGEQITARGVGNGVSLIIFSGIVAALPNALVQTLELGRTGALSALFIIALAAGVMVVVAVVVFVETAQRRIIVQYPKRQVGNKMYGGEASHLPLKINTSGVIPPIFASSLLLFPATIASFQGQGGEPGIAGFLQTYLAHGTPLYLLSYIGLIVFFCFFYTTVVFNPTDTAENLKKNGGFVPGIRPGKNTAEYLEYILNRLTMIGAIYLSAVCILPELLIARGGVPFYFGGTSLLIVVSVTLDTVTQIQAHLLAHQYEGLIKKARLRGRR